MRTASSSCDSTPLLIAILGAGPSHNADPDRPNLPLQGISKWRVDMTNVRTQVRERTWQRCRRRPRSLFEIIQELREQRNKADQLLEKPGVPDYWAQAAI